MPPAAAALRQDTRRFIRPSPPASCAPFGHWKAPVAAMSGRRKRKTEDSVIDTALNEQIIKPNQNQIKKETNTMKTLQELYKEIIASGELKAAFTEAAKGG